MKKIDLLKISAFLFIAFMQINLYAYKLPDKDSIKTTDKIPSDSTFIEVEQEPSFDLSELQRNVIYPEAARRANIQGQVVVRVYIDTNGKPKKWKIEASDSQMLKDAAVNAVLKTTYSPAYTDKKPVGCWISIPITFQLKN